MSRLRMNGAAQIRLCPRTELSSDQGFVTCLRHRRLQLVFDDGMR